MTKEQKNEYSIKWKKNNQEKVKKYARKAYLKHLDKNREYNRGWWKRNTEKCRIYRHKALGKNMQRQYGISLKDYHEMCKEQNGKCKICGIIPNGRLHIDHDHKTNKVRGLLCTNCNTALGKFHDNAHHLLCSQD